MPAKDGTLIVPLKDAVDLLNRSFTVHCGTEDRNRYRRQFIDIVQSTKRVVGNDMVRMVGIMQSNAHLVHDFYTRLIALERRAMEASPCPACKTGLGQSTQRPARYTYKKVVVRIKEQVSICSNCSAEYYTEKQRNLLEERVIFAYMHLKK